jgi:hypothetical protein
MIHADGTDWLATQKQLRNSPTESHWLTRPLAIRKDCVARARSIVTFAIDAIIY